MGRLVITHSTYLEGLIPWLKALAREKTIKSVTPGSIQKVRGRSEQLQLRISRKTVSGYKLVARKGSSAQEVYVITESDIYMIKEAIERTKIK